jgi:hypothetical protein
MSGIKACCFLQIGESNLSFAVEFPYNGPEGRRMKEKASGTSTRMA